MKGRLLAAIGLGVAVSALPGISGAFDFATLDEEIRGSLLAGEAVQLPKRPDETAEVDRRFVTICRLLEGTQREIWEVIHDKEDAELFLDGVLESRVIEADETTILVEQKTEVGGPKGAYSYRLRHTLTPYSRSDFTFVSGEIRDVVGSWWILEGPDEKRCLVVYSLHIDPGRFAPQIVVKRGMRKSMPDTIQAMQREVLRRRESGRNKRE